MYKPLSNYSKKVHTLITMIILARQISLVTFVLLLALINSGAAIANQQDSLAQAIADKGYERQEVMLPMRDGIKLFTVIYTPIDKSQDYPVLLLRTAGRVPTASRSLQATARTTPSSAPGRGSAG